MISLLPSCALKCGTCRPGQIHNCRTCGAQNSHRTDDCPNSCIFKCGWCKPGQIHNCRTCGAKNSHRTVDCPTTNIKQTCALNCNFCKPGDLHLCRTCGALDSHFTRDCPSTNITQNCPSTNITQNCLNNTQTIVVPKNVAASKNAAAYIIRLNNKQMLEILLCRRGVGGDMYNKIFGPGGAIDFGETDEQAAIRETKEEAGVDISQYINTPNARVHRENKTTVYNIFVGYDCIVNGPHPDHAWEISKNSIIASEAAGPRGCGWYWVEISHAIQISISEHGDKHWFTENLRKCYF